MWNVGRSALAVLAASVIAGCGGTVSGTAVREGADPAATAVNPGALNTGSYPITPQPLLGNASTYDVGRLIEGRRMAGYVVGPWQVDPGLIRAETTGASVIINRDRLGLVLWPPMMTRTPLLPLIVGFVAERKAADPKDPTSLRNVVLRYPDPGAAAAVAAGMAAGALLMPVDTGQSTEPIPTEPIRPVPIPGRADVNGALLTRHDGTQTIQELVVASAHGPYVLVQDVQTAQGPDRAAALAGKTLDLQGPLIDKFQPTDPAQFLTLPLDPTGLVARTLPINPAQATTMSNAAYDPAAALQLEDDPIEAASAFADAGVDVVSVGQTTVYQTTDPDSAQRLAQVLSDDTAKRPGSEAAAAVPGLPQSRCVRIDNSGGLVQRHWCIASVDRYAFKAVARQLDNAQQELAAQYRVLTS
jgi:hypothetical protein